MTDYAAQIAEARKHGYSDDQIVQYLGQSDKNVSEALSAGHSAGDIVKYLSESTETTAKKDYQRKPVDALDAAFREEAPSSYLAMQNPKEALKGAKEAAATGIETGGQILGGLGGGAVGGPFGAIGGGVGGYTLGRQLTGALGLREPESVLKSAGVGLATEIVPRAVIGGATLAGRTVLAARDPVQRAAQWAREAAGSQLPAIQAANLAQPNVLASQAAAGVPNIPAYQALLRTGEAVSPNLPAAGIRSTTAKGHQDTLNILAGGPDETTRLATNLIDRSRLTSTTAPLRTQAMKGAQTAVTSAAEQKALQLEEAVKQNPLNVNSINSQIDAKLSNPEYGMNSQLRTALTNIKGMLNNFADNNGIISPEALYAARKNGITSVIDSMEGLDATAKQKLASKVLGQLKPVLDDAITTAGGKDWANYLEQYTAKSAKIDQKELFGKLSDLYKNDPEQFVVTVKGGNPKLVQDIFGYGEYNIQKALGDKYNAILKMANNAEKELGITASAKAGVASLNKILADKGGVVNTLANLASAKMPLTNKLVEGLQGSVSKNAMNVLQNAVMSGKNMNQLLNTAPYSVKAELARAIQGNPLIGGITTATLNQGQQ